MAELKPCPVCGAKAFLSHDVVDGFDFGFSIGCPRYCIGDGIHGIETVEENEKRRLAASCFFSKEKAEEWWNRRVSENG